MVPTLGCWMMSSVFSLIMKELSSMMMWVGWWSCAPKYDARRCRDDQKSDCGDETREASGDWLVNARSPEPPTHHRDSCRPNRIQAPARRCRPVCQRLPRPPRAMFSPADPSRAPLHRRASSLRSRRRIQRERIWWLTGGIGITAATEAGSSITGRFDRTNEGNVHRCAS